MTSQQRAWLWIAALIVLAAITAWVMRQKLAAMADRATTPADKLLWPVPGFRHVSTVFQKNRKNPVTGVIKDHLAIDIGDAGIGDITGADIVASDNGTVLKTYYNSAGGNQLLIELDNKVVLGYAHLQKALVTKGQRVKRGQVIAKVGNTGVSTSSHLHFTVTDPFGEKLDPQPLLA